MRVRILGPFFIEDGGRPITIGGARQRAVLADLLLHANEVVPSERILVDLWGEDAPPSAANALQAAVSRLRRLCPPGRLVTMPPGYMLRVFQAELDAGQFEQLIFDGRDALAAGRAAAAGQLLDQAMVLWRGPPLLEFRYEPFAQAEITRLEELRLDCLEERYEAHLAVGSVSAITAELGRMVTDYPLRERLRGQLMLALYRGGRQAEALETYREFRGTLEDELGLEPSLALRDLQAAILRHDPSLAPGSATTRVPLVRRPVTVLCAALQVAPSSGFTLDPEAHGAVTEHIAVTLTAVLERHGGKLATSNSDQLIGVFGVSALHEDDALRAVRASLEAREALTAATILPSHYRARVEYRFGLATGEVLIGGSDPLGFAGDVGARALRLATAAGPGQILMGHQTQQLAAGAVETERIGPDRFLLRSAHADLRALPVRLDAPLVGRGEEMRRLSAAYAKAAREQVTMTVTVIGEAGIGKTRLVHEFAAGLGGAAQVLTGRCLPYGEGITFWPLQEIVRQAGGGDDSAARIEDLLAGETDAAAVAEHLYRAFALEGQGRTAAGEIFWAARRFLETLARRRPVLAVFEDVHWAEPTLLDLVESLALEPGQSPIALVCVGRQELLDQRPAWAAEAERSVCVQLAPLGDDSAEVLLDSLSAGQPILPSIRARLIDTAGGNPLYLEQLAVSLSEQTGSDFRPALPPTIEALLSARLQRLGPGAGSVLVHAAIVGKDFSEREIRGLLPAEARGPLSRNLRVLMAKGLVQRRPPGGNPDEEYTFRHILIQEAAYRSIPKSLRAQLHHRYADSLESIVSDPVPARSEILGYHLEQAARYRTELLPVDPESVELSLRAAAHLEAAGGAAHDRGDDVAAVNLLDRAAALLPGDDPALGRLSTTLGTALIEAGQLEKARATLDQALRITAAHGDERQHARARAEILLLRLKMDPDEAEMEIARALPELLREFEVSGDNRGICRTLQLEAALHWNHSRSGPAENAWFRAADYARAVDDRRQLADIVSWLASAALWGPTPAPAGIQRCQDYLDEIGNHTQGKAEILLNLAGLYAMQDDFTAARATLGSAKSLLEALGPTMTAVMLQPAALIAMLDGDLAAAEAYLRVEYDSLYSMGERRFLATTAATLARAIAAQGPDRHDEALRLVTISRDAAADEDLCAQAVGRAVHARILAGQGRYREAEELARSAADLTARTDLLSDHADVQLELAHVLAAAGDVAEAQLAATRALDLYRRKGNLPGAREALRRLIQFAPT